MLSSLASQTDIRMCSWSPISCPHFFHSRTGGPHSACPCMVQHVPLPSPPCTHTCCPRERSPHRRAEARQAACLLQLGLALLHVKFQGLPGLRQCLLPLLHCMGLRAQLPHCASCLQQFLQLGSGWGIGREGSYSPRVRRACPSHRFLFGPCPAV